METAVRICKRFHSYLRMGSYTGKVHSVLENTLNIATPFGIVTLQAAGSTLQPFSCVVGAMKPFSQLGIKEGDGVVLEDELINVTTTGFCVDVSQAQDVELSVDALTNIFIPLDLPIRLRHLYRVIELNSDNDDLSALIVEGKDKNRYCEQVAGKLDAFSNAVNEQEMDKACAAAVLVSGFGQGYMPASDDMLCGYLDGYSALSHALGRKRERVLSQTQQIAWEIAQHTNEISAAFLLKCGEGLLSEDMFQLMRSLFSDMPYTTLNANAVRVARSYGGSGIDILVGVYLAIDRHYSNKLTD